MALLIPAGDYVAVQWAIWRCGGIAVPLSLSATEPEWEYTLSDSQAQTVVTTSDLQAKIEPLVTRLGLRLLIVEQIDYNTRCELPSVDPDRRAMILYTSGTTSKPKGVVTTHLNIQAQIESLVDAWRWQRTDRIPLFLPLHHIHGIINVMSCALWTGATIEPFGHFDMNMILARVSAGAYTLFMAVPTIYVKLIETIEGLPADRRSEVVNGFAGMRLMVSGSAALPASVHQAWTSLTGQQLLERYGMTEIGMALSNPYDGERRPGAVGQPLPGPHDAPVTYRQVGFLDPPDSGEPLPEKLEAFLAAGPPPIYVGFGSMPDPHPEQTTQRLLDVIAARGARAVISAGWAGLGSGPLSNDVLALGAVPHAKLFPRVAAVVHHGGAGTTSSAARAGAPQILVPHLLDQFYFARRVRELGVGVATGARRGLDFAALAECIDAVLENEILAERASALGERMRARDPHGAAADRLLSTTR